MLRTLFRCFGVRSYKKFILAFILFCALPAIFFVLNDAGHNDRVRTSDIHYLNTQESSSDVVKEQKHNLLIREETHEETHKPMEVEKIASKSELRTEIPGYEEYARRRHTVLKGCRKKRNSDWLDQWPRLKGVPRLPNSPILSIKDKALFCIVGKVASSFFTRWILSMYKPKPMPSPYLIPIEKAGRGNAENLLRFRSTESKKEFMESSVKIAFGRDPFSRIFSAYIDKLYSPNPYYWKIWGQKALTLNKAPLEYCGAHVTFPQFVRLVTHTLVHQDVHLKEVANECNMCEMYYDVIGKLETTVPDLDYASSLINISSSFQHEPGYKRQALEDVVLDSLKSAFSWKSDIKKCISLDEMGKRIWRKLHIRGVIDSEILYPFQNGDIDNMNVNSFIEILKKAISDSTDSAKLKRQKKQAMEEAFLTLTGDEAENILKTYSMDFALFGYSQRPNFVFDDDYRKRLNVTDFLNWDKPWHLQ